MSEAGITDWKSEWYELRKQMECKEAKHHEEVNTLRRKITELESGCNLKEFVEKLIAKLNEEREEKITMPVRWTYVRAIEIVNELAEPYQKEIL